MPGTSAQEALGINSRCLSEQSSESSVAVSRNLGPQPQGSDSEMCQTTPNRLYLEQTMAHNKITW